MRSNRRGRVFLALGIASICLTTFSCLAAPLRWLAKPASDWSVRVVDKTVPHRDYREHRALFWVLRHEKARTPEGSTGWALASDYVGFKPQPEIESRGEGRAVTAADLQGANLLFVADTYGVYTGDYEHSGQRAALDYSARIFGGLELSEVELIEQFVGRGGGLIAEFNTFAHPTTGVARSRMENLLGVKWSGWTGRSFPDLADEREVPAWAFREWRTQNDSDWSFEGPGYIVVHENATLLVLRRNEEVTARGLRVSPTGNQPLTDGVLGDIAFEYWFDIVAPQPGAVVQANFDLDLTEAGIELLSRHHVPSRFPAVVSAGADGSPVRLYMAGDFSDAARNLGPHYLEGLPWFNRTIARLSPTTLSENESFYWGFYIPLLRNVLAQQPPAMSAPAESISVATPD